MGKTPLMQALCNTVSRFMGLEHQLAMKSLKMTWLVKGLRPAMTMTSSGKSLGTVDCPCLHDDGAPQEVPAPFWSAFLEVFAEDATCRVRYNASKFCQAHFCAIVGDCFEEFAEPLASGSVDTLSFEDWICCSLPPKLHSQHFKAIIKRAWFCTLGEKN
eukprot:5528787-Amphidinium_carterae.1